MRRLLSVCLVSILALSGPAFAQDDQTLADIRQELTVLHVEIQKLKRELSTTGSPKTNLSGSSVLDRVGSIESELNRLTAKTETLEHRIDRIVADGTNRIGNLEFRLVELEGGDVSQLGEISTLGGDVPATSGGGSSAPQDDLQLAVGERADFEAAEKALKAGDYAKASKLFAAFDQAYPGSPLAGQAQLGRGKAFDGLGDTREAARAYLAGFSADANGPAAAENLYELGAALGRLGQVEQACITLGEVSVRFPSAGAVSSARSEMAELGCS